MIFENKSTHAAVLTLEDGRSIDLGRIEEWDCDSSDRGWRLRLLTEVPAEDLAGDAPPMILTSDNDVIFVWSFHRPDDPASSLRIETTGDCQMVRHMHEGWIESVQKRLGKPTEIRMRGGRLLFERI